MASDPAQTLPRPQAVTIGLPYLAVAWAGLIASAPGGLTGDGRVFPMLVWTAIWYAALYRAWRGGPIAFNAVIKLTLTIPAIILIGVVAIGAIMISTDRDLSGLPPSFTVALLAYAGSLVVGFRLRRADVRAWILSVHPPKTAAEAAVAGVPAVAAGGRPGGANRNATPPAPLSEPLVLDIGAQMRQQARFRIGCFGVLLAFFPGLPLVVGIVAFVRDGDAELLLPAVGLVLALVGCLVISVMRFRRRHRADAVLTIDAQGLHWSVDGEVADFAWSALAGVGISYALVSTRRGRTMHLPQLDVFEISPQTSTGRWPTLDARRRDEPPPNPALPSQRIRLMVPSSDPVHRQIEAAVQAYRPQAWLGWFQRSRSDTPWFLR